MEAAARDSTQPSATAEEEALKKNTDCVYFLASPLTCKKGSECEYRHSEPARINPRDCWFWMNGNCLNPKCSFRHPPLDGLLGTSGASYVGSYMPAQTGASTKILPLHAPAYSSAKQSIPCIFFQKGLCLKGDRCPFTHGPQPTSNLPSQPPSPPPKVVPITEPQDSNKASFWGLEKFTKQQQIPRQNFVSQVEVPSSAKSVTKPEIALSKNGVPVKKSVPPITVSDDECLRYKPANGSGISGSSISRPSNGPGIIGNSLSRSHRSRQAQVDEQSLQNGKEGDDYLGESSPGFDVLVDNELSDYDYYQKEDDVGRTRSHNGRHLTSVNEFDYDNCSVNHSSMNKFDREPYKNAREYDLYGRSHDHYAWQQSRASSERVTERPSLPEQRGFTRSENPDQISESDLRHQLSKQRRVGGSRSAISSDRHGDHHWRVDHDHHIEDRRNRSQSWRESRHLLQAGSISNRLQGRVTFPGRSSPDNNNTNGMHPEREMDRGRKRGRLSPGRAPVLSYQGRHQSILKRKSENLNMEERNCRAPLVKRDEVGNSLDFAGPKSLAELKGAKVTESKEDHQQGKDCQVFSVGEQRNSKIGKCVAQEYEDSLSFESPKPLSMILKRKRVVETAASGNNEVSGMGDSDIQREGSENHVGNSSITTVAEIQTVLSSDLKKEANESTVSNQENPINSAALIDDEEGEIFPEGEEVAHEGESYAQDGSEVEIDDTMEDQELETFDKRDGESDYEQADDDQDYRTEEVENMDPEEEYLDDEDGDDFAKRISIMFSEERERDETD